MLGISVLILLGFFLYYYRPKNLESRFRQSLSWSEFAKGCFFCQSIFLIIWAYISFIFVVLLSETDLQFWMENHNVLLYPFDDLRLYSMMTNIFVFGFPVISALFTQKKIVEPLREAELPRKYLCHLIVLFSVFSLIGSYFVDFIELFFSGVAPYVGLELIFENMTNSILYSLPLSTILLVGICAVEISGLKFYRRTVQDRAKLLLKEELERSFENLKSVLE